MSTSNSNQSNPGSNKRLGLVLLTVVIVFFVGIFAKKILLG